MTNSERAQELKDAAEWLRSRAERYRVEVEEREHKRFFPRDLRDPLNPVPRLNSAEALIKNLIHNGVLLRASTRWVEPLANLTLGDFGNFEVFIEALYACREDFNIEVTEWDTSSRYRDDTRKIAILRGFPMVAGVLEREADKITGKADQPAVAPELVMPVNNPASAAPATKRFAVAFSFPGEKRAYVEAVDECLTKSIPNESVFYDNRFKADLARPNLDIHLQEIYSNAELVVVFLCADYQRKPWCGLEWRPIRAMIGKKLDAKIMLFRFDNAKVDGIFDIDGYIDAGTHPPEEAVKLILQRLGSNRRQARGSRKRKPHRH